MWHSLCLFNGPWVFPLSISKNWVLVGRQEYSLCLFVENRLSSSQGWTWTSSASLHIQQLHLSSPQMSQLFFFLYIDTPFYPLLCFQCSCSPTRPSDHWSWTLRFSRYRVETSTQCTNLQWMHSKIQVWISQCWWQRLEGKTKHGLILLNPGYWSAFSFCIGLCLHLKEK